MGGNSWNAGELARGALDELPECKRADLLVAMLVPVARHATELTALGDLRNALTERISDIIADRYVEVADDWA